MYHVANLCGRCRNHRHPGPMTERPQGVCEACGAVSRQDVRPEDMDADYVDYDFFHGPKGWVRTFRAEETIDPTDLTGTAVWTAATGAAVRQRVDDALRRRCVVILTFRACSRFTFDFLHAALAPLIDAEATPSDVVLLRDAGTLQPRLDLALERIRVRNGKRPVPGYSWKEDDACPAGVYDRLCHCPACTRTTLDNLPPCKVCGAVGDELAWGARCGACGVARGDGVDTFHAEIKAIIEEAKRLIEPAGAWLGRADYLVRDLKGDRGDGRLNLEDALRQASRKIYRPGEAGSPYQLPWNPTRLVETLVTRCVFHDCKAYAGCPECWEDEPYEAFQSLDAYGPQDILLKALQRTLDRIGDWRLEPKDFPYDEMIDPPFDEPNTC